MSEIHVAIRRAFEARRTNQEALKAVYDAAEGRALSADEKVKEDAILVDMADLAARELELVDLAESQSRSSEYFEKSAAAGISNEKPVVEGRSLRSVLRDIGSGAAVGPHHIELRDAVTLQAGSATDGAELLQTDLSFNLVDYLQASIGSMRAGSTVITTSGGNALVLPTVSSHSTILLEGETDTIAKSAPQLSSVQLDSYKYAVLIQASRELLEDAAFPFENFLIEQATDEIGRLVGTEYITGSGSGAPQGIDLATTLSVTSASTTEWTADELISVFHTLTDRYRERAAWIMNDGTVQELRSLKDSSGQYMWQPGLSAGLVDTLFGKKVVTDNAVMVTATGNESLIFGDLARAYTIRLVGGLDVSRSDSFAFDSDLTTWRFVLRTDGVITDENAVVIGHNA